MAKKRKLIEWRLDDPDHVVEFLSLVSNPAIQVNWKAFSGDAMTFKSIDEEKRMIAGPAMIPNIPIYREIDGEPVDVFFSADTIENLAKKFFRSKSVLNLDEEHSGRLVPAFVLESWFITDPQNDKSNSLGFSNLPVGTWFVIAHVEDNDFWESRVRTGMVRGFSVELSGYESKETNMSKKNKFNDHTWKTVNGELLTPADDSSDLAVNQKVMIQNADGTMSDPTNGTYELENGDTVTVTDGFITEIKQKEASVPAMGAEERMALTPEDIAAVMAEVQPMLDTLKEEHATVIAEMASRVAALEAALADQVATMEEKLSAAGKKLEETETELKKFTSTTPGAPSFTLASIQTSLSPAEERIQRIKEFHNIP